MQRVIFLSTFFERDTLSLIKRVLFPDGCVKRFFKAIVISHKKVNTFFLHFENQHFLFRNVGFFLFAQTISNKTYVRQFAFFPGFLWENGHHMEQGKFCLRNKYYTKHEKGFNLDY